MKTTLRVSAVAALATTCLAPVAHGQTAQSATTPGWTGEIVVTGVRGADAVPNSGSATRTDTPMIQIPQSVQVLTKTLIAEQDRRTLGDALVNVSGVVPTRTDEVLLINPIIRGLPAEVYIDGLPIFGGNQQAFDPASLVGVERIEVLKGPSATLYGGGLGSPLGGLINIVSERPNDTLGGYLAMRAGSYSTVNPYGDINVPLAPGVAARVAADYQTNNSWIDQVTARRWTVQPSIAFQIDPQTDLLLQGQINRRSQLEYSGLPASLALSGAIDPYAFPGAPVGQPRTSIDTNLATATLRHAFTSDLKLTVSARYYGSTVNEFGSFVDSAFYAPDPATPTAFPVVPLDMYTVTKEATFDANLLARTNALGGHHTFLVGVDYDWTSFFSGMGFSGGTDGTIDLANPVYNLSWGAYTPINLTETDHYLTFAGYAQDQADYGPLHLTGSLRYTQLTFREFEEGTDKTYHHLSPRIGATLDVAHGVALFAGFATTFRGAFGYINAGMIPPKPESSRNFEGGLKLALPAAKLTGTIAGFYQTHDNVATADPNNLYYRIQVGRQRAQGAEAHLTWEPTPAVSVIANYAYTDAKVTQDDNTPSEAGSILPRVPRSSGRIAARYRVPNGAAKGLAFGAGITAKTSTQTVLPNGMPPYSAPVPGYAVADAQVDYDFGKFAINVSVVNLGGRKAFDAYQYFAFPVVAPIQPRSAYVTLKGRF